MIWILAILLIGAAIFLSGCKPTPNPQPDPNPDPDPDPDPPPIPDPFYKKWQLVKTDTSRWAAYFAYMQKITSDSLMALEMIKTVDGKKFYVWTAEFGDYWDLPDEVWESGKVDCDGFARLTADGLGRFAKYPDVWWLEYYGYYREYVYNPTTGEYSFSVVLGGHAITVYKKNDELLAFSNTNWWWNKNFQDFIEIGEETFPEGIVLIRCRNWETGVLQWVQEAPGDEILEGSCVFDREKIFEGKKSDRDGVVI